MALSLVLVVISTAAAVILSLVRSREIGFVAFTSGCATALVWGALQSGREGLDQIFGLCFSAGVIWWALEMFVIEKLRTPTK